MYVQLFYICDISNEPHMGLDLFKGIITAVYNSSPAFEIVSGATAILVIIAFSPYCRYFLDESKFCIANQTNPTDTKEAPTTPVYVKVLTHICGTALILSDLAITQTPLAPPFLRPTSDNRQTQRSFTKNKRPKHKGP